MPNVLGPQAGNETTVRPGRSTAYGPNNTWHKPCSSPTARDGTVLDADMLNDFLAQFRTAFVGTGITIDNADDMLLRAIRSIAPMKLVSPASYYVNKTSGSDSNAGTAPGTAFATIGKALSMMTLFDTNGFDFAIYVADATYNESVTLPRINGSGRCLIFGNLTNPENCKVTAPGTGRGFYGPPSIGEYVIAGFSVAAASSNGLSAGGAGTAIKLYNMEWRACGVSHIDVVNGAMVIFPSSGLTSPFQRIVGVAPSFMTQTNLSISTVDQVGQALIIPSPVAFTTFVKASNNSVMSQLWASISGTATGKKFDATSGALILTDGQAISWLPGDVAGTASSGGQYL